MCGGLAVSQIYVEVGNAADNDFLCPLCCPHFNIAMQRYQ